MKHPILYVDDDASNLDTFRRAFRFDYEVQTAASGAAGLEVVRKTPELALIVADQRMPHMKGTEFLERVMEINPHAQRIILTAFTDIDALLAAIQRGHVYDYVVKPWEPAALKNVVEKALALYEDRIEKIKQLVAARSKNEGLKEMVRERHDFTNIIGADGGLAEVIAQVKKVAAASSTVLIRGESGTGKELIAHAIHAASPRADGPLVKLNCAALSPGVLESELFGHEKGAFTGAVMAKKGRFEFADGGTLFLDEIGDLPEVVQVKLLRVLQEREFERVGGTETKRIDVRLIAATHQPLERMIEERKFRQDLFYRINVVPIIVPPLRSRRGDIPKLAAHFLSRYNAETDKALSIDAEAMRLLEDHDWPGNVRELGNAIERAVIMGEEMLSPEDFSVDFKAMSEAAGVQSVDLSKIDSSLLASIQGEQTRELAAALRQSAGNVSEAARMLEIARSTLIYRLKKYRLL